MMLIPSINKEKHKETYTMPQLSLWARMIHCGTHNGYDLNVQEENLWQTQLQKLLRR